MISNYSFLSEAQSHNIPMLLGTFEDTKVRYVDVNPGGTFLQLIPVAKHMFKVRTPYMTTSAKTIKTFQDLKAVVRSHYDQKGVEKLTCWNKVLAA